MGILCYLEVGDRSRVVGGVAQIRIRDRIASNSWPRGEGRGENVGTLSAVVIVTGALTDTGTSYIWKS